MKDNEAQPATTDRAAGFRLAARLNEAFRRHQGLTGYVHHQNRIEDEHCMYDALVELGFVRETPPPIPWPGKAKGVSGNG